MSDHGLENNNPGIDLALYRIILDNSSDPIFCIDNSGKYLYVNNAFAAPFKIKPSSIIGGLIWDIFPGSEGDQRFNAVKIVFETGEMKVIEVKVQAKEGNSLYFITSIIPVKNSQGQPQSVICISKDITERKNIEKALKLSESRLLAAQSMAHVGSWELDLANNKIWGSEEAFNIYGIDYTSPYLPLELVQQSMLPEYRHTLDVAIIELIKNNKTYDYEFKIKKHNTSQEVFVHSKAILVRDDRGQPVKITGSIQDITEQKKREEDIFHLSYRDQLTGLYNRRFYEEELRRLDNQRNLPITIVMIDVNGLKLINDSFGHALGDQLLKKVAEVITRGCRGDDIIARLGGDEFVVLLPKTDSEIAERIVRRIKSLVLKEKIGHMDISVSFGYEAKISTQQSIQEIFKIAEDNMYRQKLVFGKSMRGKTIEAIITTLHEKNIREEQHSHRVAEICINIGEALYFTQDKINELKTIGLLHDIGKIAIDETILNKKGSLSEYEWQEIKRHPEIGFRILSTAEDMADMANNILCHHERWDGEGYPKGLKGQEIPIISRIVAIADAYDAMTSERSYQEPLEEDAAIEELQKNAGTQFDPHLVGIFIQLTTLQ
ncbi:MAG: diguanylate cyclase [Peptococcaceae bacterium]|nr:diguanylate cyclase [Peptococcaceae bacterium]